MRKKSFDYNKLFYAVGWLLLIIAVALFVLSLIMQNETVQLKYADIKNAMYKFEVWVISLNDKWIIFLLIEVFFLLRSFMPFPISLILVIAGAVFSPLYSFIMCMLGLTVQLLIGYYWGKNKGGGKTFEIISRFEPLADFIEQDGRGNPWLLFISRLIPYLSVNIVSKIYGSYNFKCSRFLVISLIGMLPKVISLIWFGNNIYNPFSAKFFVPIIILFTISGLAVLAFNTIINWVKKSKKGENKEYEIFD